MYLVGYTPAFTRSSHPEAGTSVTLSPLIPSFSRFIRHAWTGFLDLMYPPRCLRCSARTPDVTLPLCMHCLRQMEQPSLDEVTEHIARLPAAHQALDGAMALWTFDRNGALQRLQHALKYGNRPRYGRPLGELIGTAYRKTRLPPPDAVVPIPLHRTRYLERGYNQSRMLAEGIGCALDVPIRTDLLRRPHPTRAQANLSRVERWQNVRDAFAVPDPPAIEHPTLLLVDDVLTTGSTATAAAHTLKEAGVSTVLLATLGFARD